jgi:hypothetical protein
VILFSEMFGIFGSVAVIFEGVYVLLEPYFCRFVPHMPSCTSKLSYAKLKGGIWSTNTRRTNTSTSSFNATKRRLETALNL